MSKTQKTKTIAKLAIVSTAGDGTVVVSTAGTKATPGSSLNFYRLQWGDGQEATGSAAPASTLSHTYSELGQKHLLFNVRDTKGGIANTDVFVAIVAPTVLSIQRQAPSPTTATGGSWAVRFSEPVTGVAPGAFALVNTGLTSPALTGLSGSGANYTVTADRGTGTGTLGLNLVDGSSIVSVSTGLALTGTPVVGDVYTFQEPDPGPGPDPGPPDVDYAFYCQGGYAGPGTVRQTDGSNADVQAKIDAASHGDIVCLPIGTCHFQTPVGNGGKDIFILGAGIGSTIVNLDAGQSYFFSQSVSSAIRGNWRISGMTLNGGAVGAYIAVAVDAPSIPTGRHRIDHIHFNGPAGFTTAIKHLGPTWGLVDHCTIDQFGGVSLIHQMQLPGETYFGNAVAAVPTGFGGSEFVFYEDNTLTMHNVGSTLFGWDSSGGAGRPVMRYNQFIGTVELYNHWTRGGEICMTAGEFYNNTWTFRPGDPRPGDGLARFEAGTFLFYNNASLNCPDPPFINIDDRRAGAWGGESAAPFGSCDGSHPWDGNAGDPSAPGWPCLGQIGRGWTALTSLDALVAGTVEQPSEPAYLWNNGEQAGCATGGACVDSIFAFPQPSAYVKKTTHPNGQVDFVEGTPKPGYTPYTYPHPLQGQAWNP